MSYYFISIGGSGAKVMESLTHLCVAGMFPTNERLYVMSIDPDTGNGNLARSSAALNCYNTFQNLEVGNNIPLFKNKVELARPFTWNPTEHDKCLDDVMAYQAYKGTSIGDLYEVLYTKKERSTLLNEGFRGHPSIGAAVMAKKVNTENSDRNEEPWHHFEVLVNQDAKTGSIAKIFLAGSVFGGTGAAGMPTIAKLLHHTFKDLYNEGKVVLGGALILPYFSFTADKNDKEGLYASSENFLTNTQAALKYYVSKNKEEDIYNSMYFIGDDVLAPVQKFSVGSSSQQNDAHIVDFYGALAAIDFYRSTQLKKCSYIAHTERNKILWSDFPDLIIKDEHNKDITVNIKDRFAQFTRFIFAYLHLVKPVLGDLASDNRKAYQYPWFVDYFQNVDVETAEVKNFESYAESFVSWLSQLEKENREINMVNPGVIVSEQPATINPNLFSNCVGDEDSNVTISELWYRLCENVDKNQYASGFGRFLRALYISCEKR